MRPSYAEVDLAAVAGNLEAIGRVVAPARICAVVKADAYGHGDLPIAETALEAGAVGLAVALVEEGIRLREGGIEAPILLLSEPVLADAGLVIQWRLTPTVYRAELIAALAHLATQPLGLHLKVDTGMHRVGVAPERALALAQAIVASPPLELAGVWSHLAVADEDPVFTNQQRARFEEVLAGFSASGIEVPVRHLANTAGGLLYPGTRYDMVRVGLGMYGLHPCPSTANTVSLRPALRVVSHVSHLQRLAAGERPSYGRTRPLQREATVATIPIGYADGVPRLLSSRGGEVAISGRRYPLAGTVTMDQILVDVGDEPIAVGDEVEILGGSIPAEDWAERLETITYEVVARFGPRLPRRYQG